MLKAIRFDTEEHKELLDYISSFTDKKGRHNESEAMRSLMLKGLESLNAPQTLQQTPQLDVDAIKNDLFNQVMSMINQQQLSSPPVSAPASVRVSHVKPEIDWEKEQKAIAGEIEKNPPRGPEIETPKPKPNVATNPLLANMLGNIRK